MLDNQGKTRPTLNVATAQIWRDEDLIGTAVLIDAHHLLTARHVIEQANGNLLAEPRVSFPSIDSSRRRITEVVADSRETDLAVLSVISSHRESLPLAVNLWPDDLIPDLVSVYGYADDSSSGGVWRSFRVRGAMSDKLHQLRELESISEFHAHDGSPVFEAASDWLVGILVGGAESALPINRFIALPAIADIWPELTRPWRIAGACAPAQLQQRASAQVHRVQGGNLFRGRRVALDAISSWLNSPSSLGCPLVVTGQPGSGKSTVVSRAALSAQAVIRRGCFYDAREASALQFTEALGSFLGIPAAHNVDDLLAGCDDRPAAEKVVIMVDALDEASSSHDIDQIADSLAEISRLPTFRVVIGTRPLAAGIRFGPGSLLEKLLVSGEASENLVDLDVPPFQDREAIELLAGAALSQEGAVMPGPSNRAWQSYRRRHALRTALAKSIAERADSNFLVAAISATALSRAEDVVDPYAPDFDISILASRLGVALEKYLSTVDEPRRRQVTNLLTALSYARGEGIDQGRWLSFALALGYPVGQADLDHLQDSAGADYLLQVEPKGEDRVFRLFHRALVEELKSKHGKLHEARIYYHMHAEITAAGGWSQADRYSCFYAAEHAARSGELPSLLSEPAFLAHAQVSRLVSAIESIDPGDRPLVGRLVALEEVRLNDRSPSDRLWLLAMCALHAGDYELRSSLLEGQSPGLKPTWALQLANDYQKCIGHSARVSALTIGRLGREDVIISGDSEGVLLVWNKHGRTVLGPIVGHKGGITALCTGRLNDQDVFVSGGRDFLVRVWGEDGSSVCATLEGHTKAPSSISLIELHDDSVVVSVAPRGEILAWNADGNKIRQARFDHPLATIGSIDGAVRVLAAGYYSAASYSIDTGLDDAILRIKAAKTALAVGRLGRTEFVFVGFQDAYIVALRLDGSEGLARRLDDLSQPVRAISVGRFGVGECIAAANSEASAIWDYRGNLLIPPWSGPPGSSGLISLGAGSGSGIVACSGTDRIVRIWRDRALLSSLRTSNRDVVLAIASAKSGESTFAIALSDSLMEAWNGGGEMLWQVPRAEVRAYLVAITSGSSTCVVTANDDDVLRVLDVNNRNAGERRCVGQKGVRALAVGPCDGREVIAAAGSKKIVLWSLEGNYLRTILPPVQGSEVVQLELGLFDGRELVFVLAEDGNVSMYDLGSGAWFDMSPHSRSLQASCLTALDIFGRPVIAIGTKTGELWTWQPDADILRKSVKVHSNRLVDVHALALPSGDTALVTVGDNGTVRLWSDLNTFEEFALAETATASTVAGRSVFLVAGPAIAHLMFEGGDDFVVENAVLDGLTDTLNRWLPPEPSRLELLNDKADDVAGAEFPSRSVNDQIRSAREMFRLGARRKVIHMLRPYFEVSPDALRIAVDAAFASGSRVLFEEVIPYLRSEKLGPNPTLRARLLGLATLTGRTEVAVEVLASFSEPPARAHGLIRMLDSDPGLEWEFYRHALSDEAGNVALRDFYFELAAARLMSVVRRLATEGPEFEAKKALLLQDYSSWVSRNTASKLTDALSAFAMEGGNADRFRAYQVLSVLEVLWVVSRVDDGLLETVTLQTAGELARSEARVRAEFAAWVPHSSWAALVVTVVRASFPESVESRVESTDRRRWSQAELQAEAPLVQLLFEAVEAAADGDGFAHLGYVGDLIRRAQRDFTSAEYGYKRLSQLVRAIGLFEVEERGAERGGSVAVYIRPR